MTVLRLLFRIGVLAVGLGLGEIGLVAALGRGEAIGWLLVGLALALLIAGGAGFMVPLLAGMPRSGRGS